MSGDEHLEAALIALEPPCSLTDVAAAVRHVVNGIREAEREATPPAEPVGDVRDERQVVMTDPATFAQTGVPCMTVATPDAPPAPAPGEPDEYVPLTDPDKGGQTQMSEPAWYADKVIDYGERCVAAARGSWLAYLRDRLANWQQRDDADPLNRTYEDGRRHAYEDAIERLTDTRPDAPPALASWTRRLAAQPPHSDAIERGDHRDPS